MKALQLAPGALLLLGALVASGTAGCDDTEGPSCGPSKATVINVIDGDTIELDSGEKVRYLMMDTPETTKGKNDCYGEEAKDFNTQSVLGKEISLRYDKECEDQYGRLLAYVSVGSREMNAVMVERGYACVLYIPPNGTTRKDEFEGLEEAAKSDEVGLWGACPDSEIHCDD